MGAGLVPAPFAFCSLKVRGDLVESREVPGARRLQ